MLIVVTTQVPATGTQEEAVSKAKQSRSEKKARKALSKLGLHAANVFISAQYLYTT